MKSAILFHNPSAGDETHSRNSLLFLMENEHYQCYYYSMEDPHWEISHLNPDLIVIAGGDGTIRKVIHHLLMQNKTLQSVPIAIFPMGTANNIASTLFISGTPREIIHSWKVNKTVPIQVWRCKSSDTKGLFLEGMGGGIFPALMKEMEDRQEDISDDPEKKLALAKKLLLETVLTFPARYYSIQADGIDYSGDYIFVEAVNIRSIGPNLLLAPDTNPSDDLLDLILVPESQRGRLAECVQALTNGQVISPGGLTVKAHQIHIQSDERMFHVDDVPVVFSPHRSILIDPLDLSLPFVSGMKNQ